MQCGSEDAFLECACGYAALRRALEFQILHAPYNSITLVEHNNKADLSFHVLVPSHACSVKVICALLKKVVARCVHAF